MRTYGSRSITTWLFLLALACGCATGETYRKHSEFEVGMSRDALLARFGPPDRTQTMAKTSEYVWGPIEAFWGRVPMGATVEIWSYRSKAEEEGADSPYDGFTELYFVGDSETVAGIGFAPDDVVYEADTAPGA